VLFAGSQSMQYRAGPNVNPNEGKPPSGVASDALTVALPGSVLAGGLGAGQALVALPRAGGVYAFVHASHVRLRRSTQLA